MSNIGNLEKFKMSLAENQAEKTAKNTTRTGKGTKYVARWDIEAAQRSFLSDQAKDHAIQALKEEVKDDVIAEVKIEIRDSVVQRLKEDFRAKVISDVKEEVYYQVMAELKEELRQEAFAELKEQLYDEVYGNLHAELHDYVIHRLEDDNMERVENKLYTDMKARVYNDLTETMRPGITADLVAEIRAELEPKLCQESDSNSQKSRVSSMDHGKITGFSEHRQSHFVTDDDGTNVHGYGSTRRGTKRAASALIEGDEVKGDFRDQLLNLRGYYSEGTDNPRFVANPFKRQKHVSSSNGHGINDEEDLIYNLSPSQRFFNDLDDFYDNREAAAFQPLANEPSNHEQFGGAMYEEGEEENEYDDGYEDESEASDDEYDSEEEIVQNLNGSSKDNAIALDSDDE